MAKEDIAAWSSFLDTGPGERLEIRVFKKFRGGFYDYGFRYSALFWSEKEKEWRHKTIGMEQHLALPTLWKAAMRWVKRDQRREYEKRIPYEQSFGPINKNQEKIIRHYERFGKIKTIPAAEPDPSVPSRVRKVGV